MTEERQKRAVIETPALELPSYKGRRAISNARSEFLDAVLTILEDLREYWPVSERQIHYNLLNNPSLIHASKPASRYRNDTKSSRALSDLVTRGRIDGSIPEEAISDETRPATIWNVYRDVSIFIGKQIDQFLKGYWRDPMQSQSNHVELVVEKNTVANLLETIAQEFGIPMTSGRGFSSLPPRGLP